MKRSTALQLSMVLFAAVTFIGVWFFSTEHDYAAAHPRTQLASTLQWVGVGIVGLGIGALLLGFAVRAAVVDADAEQQRTRP